MAGILRQKLESQAVREATSIVARLLSQNPFPNGFKTQQLYELALKEKPSPDFRPVPYAKNAAEMSGTHPESLIPQPQHPVRSIKFLKHRILPHFEGQGKIEVVRQLKQSAVLAEIEASKKKSAGSSQYEFVWKLVDPSKVHPPHTTKPPKPVVGTEVGVGVDFSHLNKRRLAARPGKISRDVDRMKSFRSSDNL